MASFEKMKFRNKLFLMLVLPIAGMLYFSIDSIIQKSMVSGEMRSLQNLSTLAVKISSLVHETQKERGATAGFMGSKGTKFVDALSSQRLETNNRIDALKDYLRDFNRGQFGNEFNSNLNKSLSLLDMINEKRSSASAFKISAGDAIGYYTKMNASMLNVIDFVTKLSSNAEISILSSAYVNFLKGKERAGIERAVMSNTFAKDKFSPGMYNKFSALVTTQEVYTSVFQSFATGDQKEFYINRMSQPAVAEVEEMRKIAFKKAAEGKFGIDASLWFKTITKKINLLKEIEDKLSVDLNTKASGLKGSAQSILIIYIIITSLLVAAAVVVTYFITKGILKQLGEEPIVVMQIANRIADGDLALTAAENGKDTTGLYRVMLNMTNNLRGIIGKVANASDNVTAASTEFSTMASQLAANSEQVTNQANSVVSATEQMSNNINTMASGSEEMSVNASNVSSTAEQMSHNMNTVASSVEEMTTSINQVAKNAKDAEKVSGNAAQTATVATKTMNTLGEAAHEIGNVTEVIKRIAEQTNLLALNATIEAASAGDAGKGFAVVANEIKELANQSAKAAEDIANKIKGVQDNTEDAIKIIDEVSSTITSINESVSVISNAVEQQTNAANDISSNVAEANTGVSNIASSIAEVANGANDISKNASDAAKGANDVSSNIHGVNDAATESSKSAQQVKDSASGLSNVAEELKEMVSMFKL